MTTLLCRNLARFAAGNHPQATCVSRWILPAAAAAGVSGAKPQTNVSAMSEWGARATTMAGLQTLEHVTDFSIDKSHPLQRTKEHQLASNFVLIILNYKLPAFTPLLC
eukprot:TRINITY_DN6594_c0_g1_i1.p1 TRINITY_DN6594_c0_g1~~TRINITY_DN6594_c0_g1_i1.p1  ORF type:complete len:108 (+),score=12.62 TRINITY_DN6594_c0_g1_i1:549-872(+)